jgi:hypothetical protein
MITRGIKRVSVKNHNIVFIQSYAAKEVAEAAANPDQERPMPEWCHCLSTIRGF